MTLDCHVTRRRLRARLDAGTAIGTFVKLPVPDLMGVLAGAGLDFVIVDLEHSGLSEQDAVDLVRSAVAFGLPALVRVPAVDAGLVNRLLEAGAAGIQLSMLATVAQRDDLVAATRFAPAGRRSISLANPAAGFGAVAPRDFVALDAQDPPVLVGQIESADTDPLDELLTGLDVGFVGTTDLAVDLGAEAGPEALRHAVEAIEASAERVGAHFGGWVPGRQQVEGMGMTAARYLVVSSDLQVLATGLRGLAADR
ncbi:MAG: aldolase/citrate lyase family protein [Aeromicrobium sp.]